MPKFDYNPEDLLKIYYDHFGGTLLQVFELLAELGLVDSKYQSSSWGIIIIIIENKKKRTYVDCSNGVGGIHQEKLTQLYFNKIFEVVNLNTKETQYLNEECGSEHVQKEKKVPRGLLDLINQQIPQDVDLDNISFLSYDGDADRTVY